MKKWLVVIAIVALLIAHQDYWQWDRRHLVYGFIPFNMAYHICLSMLTALVWILVCSCCWPRRLSDPGNDETSAGGDHQ